MKLIHKIFIGLLISIATNASCMDIELTGALVMHKISTPTSIELQLIENAKLIGIAQCSRAPIIDPLSNQTSLWVLKTFVTDHTISNDQLVKGILFNTIITHVKENSTPLENAPRAEIQCRILARDIEFFKNKGCTDPSTIITNYFVE